MKAITVSQPHASLITLGVQTIYTAAGPRDVAPGQRIAIHAAKRQMSDAQLDMLNDLGWPVDVPTCNAGMGKVVGSAVIAAQVPVVAHVGRRPSKGEWIQPAHENDLWLCRRVLGRNVTDRDLSDQLPYIDATPGRWALILTDAAPTTTRCPECWGTGDELSGKTWPSWPECSRCASAGTCPPWKQRGRPGLWTLTKEGPET